MKKQLLVYLMFSFLLLSACGMNSAKPSTPTIHENVNTLDDVTMQVKEDTIVTFGLTVVFVNNSANECVYSEDLQLETQVNGKWYEVPDILNGNYGFNDIGYSLPAGDTSESTINWEWLYGNLDNGNYRIIKSIACLAKGSEQYTEYFLAAEFTVD